MLESEGFRFRGYVDIFDAGPTVEVEVANIKSVRESQRKAVRVAEVQSDNAADVILCNTRVADFRAGRATIQEHPDHIVISPETADQLRLQDGDHARFVAL